MKRLTIAISLLLTVFYVQAQKLTSVSDPINTPGVSDNKCRFAPFSMKADDKGFVFTIVKQQIIGGGDASVSKFFDPTKKNLNELEIYNFNSELKLSQSKVLKVAKDSTIIAPAPGYQTEKISCIPIDTVIKKYPSLFTQVEKNKSMIYLPVNGASTVFHPYEFDMSVNQYCQAGLEFSPKLNPPSDGLQYKLHTDNGVYFDAQNNIITVIWARNNQDPNETYYSLKFLTFVDYDLKGTILNKVNVDFKYVRLFESAHPVYSKGNTNVQVGKVFFFKRSTMLNKKWSDPNKGNYEVVFLDNGGNLIFQRTFNVGGEKRSSLDVLYAFADGKKLSLFVGYDTDKVGAGFLELAPDSVYNQKLATVEEIRKTSIMAPNEPDVQFFQKRESFFDDFHAKKGFGIDFGADINNISGHLLLSDGGIIVYGQRGFQKSNLNASTVPNSGPAAPPLKKYAEFFALHFDASGQFISQYISDITLNDNAVKFDASIGADNRIYLVTALPKTQLDQEKIDERSLESLLKSKTAYRYPVPYLYVPKIICINPANKSISSYTSVTPGFFVFSPNMFYSIAPDNSFYIGGYVETPQGRTLRIEKVEF